MGEINEEYRLILYCPACHIAVARLDKILILILEWIIKKISNECREYESVDEKSLEKRQRKEFGQ